MNEFQHDLILRIVKLLNMLLMTAVFSIIWFLSYGHELYGLEFYRRGNWVIALLFFLLYGVFGRTYDAFLVSLNRITEMVYSQGLALFLADFLMMIVTWLLMRSFPPVLPVLLIFILQLVFTTLWSLLAHWWYFRTFPPRKTLIVYDMREGVEVLISQYGLEKKFRAETICQVKEVLKQGVQMVEEYEAVYLCGVHSHDRNIIIKHCIACGIQTYVIPRLGDVMMSGAKTMHMFHIPVLRLDRYKPTPEFTVIKRFFDILLSAIALVILSPFMLIVALAIKSDGGPVFYKQTRLTKDGKEFKVLKFRSMRVDAEKDGVARLSAGDQDDRITAVGHIIRKIRMDEVPQLINILKGEMSIVGPRPERPEIAARYEEELPEFRLRLQAKAGLTGLAQVYGQYNTTPYDKLMMDLMYIAHPSIVEDLRIILATVKILFMPESTQGIDPGQETAMVSQKTEENKKD